jgi:hypothetical protein
MKAILMAAIVALSIIGTASVASADTSDYPEWAQTAFSAGN